VATLVMCAKLGERTWCTSRAATDFSLGVTPAPRTSLARAASHGRVSMCLLRVLPEWAKGNEGLEQEKKSAKKNRATGEPRPEV
jgi:hypothetical protein